MNSDWINDPALAGINPAKLTLLATWLSRGDGKNAAGMMPFLLAASRDAKQSGLSFTQEETDLVVRVLRRDATPEERKRIDRILSLMRMMRR